MRQEVRPLVSQPTNPGYDQLWVHELSKDGWRRNHLRTAFCWLDLEGVGFTQDLNFLLQIHVPAPEETDGNQLSMCCCQCLFPAVLGYVITGALENADGQCE